MLDDGVDQAAGLRRYQIARPAPRSGWVLPVLGGTDHLEALVPLLTAWIEIDCGVRLVSDCSEVLAVVGQTWAPPTLEAGRVQDVQDLDRGALAEPISTGVTVWVMSDRCLMTLPRVSMMGVLVLGGAGTAALATAYARIKALRACGPIPQLWMIGVPTVASDAADAQSGLARLTETVTRFLDVKLAWASAAPRAAQPADYRRLAQRLAGSVRQQAGGGACRVH